MAESVYLAESVIWLVILPFYPEYNMEVSENQRTVKHGQFAETGNIWHMRQTKQCVLEDTIRKKPKYNMTLPQTTGVNG